MLRVDNQNDEQLNELIKVTLIGSRQTYGTRRIKKQMEKLYGSIVSRRRIGRIMKKFELNTRNKRRFKVLTTDSITMQLLATGDRLVNGRQHDYGSR